MQNAQQLSNCTPTPESFQKVEYFLVLDYELDEADVSIICPVVFSGKVIGRLRVVNNTLCPCMDKLDTVLDLEGASIINQCHPRVDEQQAVSVYGSGCICHFAELYQFSMLDRLAAATHDVAHTK